MVLRRGCSQRVLALEDVLADSCVLIGPDRRSSNVRQVRAFVEAAYVRRPTGFRIRNVAVRPHASVGTFEEWQTVDDVAQGGFQRP